MYRQPIPSPSPTSTSENQGEVLLNATGVFVPRGTVVKIRNSSSFGFGITAIVEGNTQLPIIGVTEADCAIGESVRVVTSGQVYGFFGPGLSSGSMALGPGQVAYLPAVPEGSITTSRLTNRPPLGDPIVHVGVTKNTTTYDNGTGALVLMDVVPLAKPVSFTWEIGGTCETDDGMLTET